MAKRIKTQAELDAEKRKAALLKPSSVKTPVVVAKKAVSPTQETDTTPAVVAPTASKIVVATPRTPAQKRDDVESGRQSRRGTEAIRDIKLTVADRDQFHQERKAGQHGLQNTTKGIRDWKRQQNATLAARQADEKDKAAFVEQESDPRLAPQREIRDRQAKRVENLKDIQIKTAEDEKNATSSLLSMETYDFHGVKKEDVPNLSKSERKAYDAVETLYNKVASGDLTAKQALPRIKVFATQLNAGSVRREAVEQKAMEAEATQVQKEADLAVKEGKTAQLLVAKEAKAAVIQKKADRADSLDKLAEQYANILDKAADADVEGIAKANRVIEWIAAEQAKNLGIEIPAHILNPAAAGSPEPVVEQTTTVTDEGAVQETKVEAGGVTMESIKTLPKGHVLTEDEYRVILASAGGDKKKAFAEAHKMGFK